MRGNLLNEALQPDSQVDVQGSRLEDPLRAGRTLDHGVRLTSQGSDAVSA